MQAFAALTALAAPLSLLVQPEKCAVYSADCAAVASDASFLSVHHAPDVLLAASTPVGTLVFQTVHTILMEALLACPWGIRTAG
jgi:hypothetical protein